MIVEKTGFRIVLQRERNSEQQLPDAPILLLKMLIQSPRRRQTADARRAAHPGAALPVIHRRLIRNSRRFPFGSKFDNLIQIAQA